VTEGYFEGYPDGSLRLGDPVTRGLLALTIARVERRLASRPGRLMASGGEPDSVGIPASVDAGSGTPVPSFPDVGPRHYLRRAAAELVRLGLPTHSGGSFDRGWRHQDTGREHQYDDDAQNPSLCHGSLPVVRRVSSPGRCFRRHR